MTKQAWEVNRDEVQELLNEGRAFREVLFKSSITRCEAVEVLCHLLAVEEPEVEKACPFKVAAERLEE